MNPTDSNSVREEVRARYTGIAEDSGCECGCATSGCCEGDGSSYGEKLGYSASELAEVPEGSNLNLGCGNPLAIASIKPGEIVLDLGSGAGFDCFLSARQTGATGKVIGVDMTPAMISKARRNAARSGYENVEFRLGEIEAMPVADRTVDVIISNCVINLSPEKPKVFAEAFRVLKSGGRLSISDVVARKPVPQSWRDDPTKLTGCLAGAESVSNIEKWLTAAGFTSVKIASKNDSTQIIESWDEAADAGKYLVSAIIEATKP